MARFLGYYVPSILDYSTPSDTSDTSDTPKKPKAISDYEVWKEQDHNAWQSCVGSCGDACFNHTCGANNNGYLQNMSKAIAAEGKVCTNDEWLANCPQSVRDLANKIKGETK